MQSLPKYIKYLHKPQLIPEEWSAEVKLSHEIDSRGGVCLCPKQSLPDVITKIGTTLCPAAVLTVESPSALYLKGCKYTKVIITLEFLTETEEGYVKERKQVERYLIQLGRGQEVTMNTDGLQKLQYYKNMTKVAVALKKKEGDPQRALVVF